MFQKIGDKIYQNSEKIGMPLIFGKIRKDIHKVCIFWGKIRDKNYHNSEKNKGYF